MTAALALKVFVGLLGIYAAGYSSGKAKAYVRHIKNVV